MPFGIGFFATAGASGAAPAFELISTQVLTNSTTATVTFSSIPATYSHLQIRAMVKTTRPADGDPMRLRFNGITTSSYNSHRLVGNGGSVASSGGFAETYLRIEDVITSNSYASAVFMPIVLDILDYKSSNKNKTTRLLKGEPTLPSRSLYLESGLFMSTNAIASLEFSSASSSNFVAGTRFSLYGVRG